MDLKISRETMFILFFIIFFFIFTPLWGFYTAIRPSKILSNITPKNLGLDYEAVSFIVKDNLTLRGWFIPNQQKNSKAKTIILLHGYPADKGNILPGLSFLSKEYNLFLFDFRSLGQSDGRYSTMGAKETEDLLAAIRFLKSRGIDEVGIWGFSVGGAVALMTAPHSPEIKAIISESSYAELHLMTSQLYKIPFLKYPLGWLTGFWAKIFWGIDIKDVSPAKAVKNLDIPIFIIHSLTDEVIPFSHALYLKEALQDNQKAEFWFKENLGHGEIMGGEYQKRIEDFFERNLF